MLLFGLLYGLMLRSTTHKVASSSPYLSQFLQTSFKFDTASQFFSSNMRPTPPKVICTPDEEKLFTILVNVSNEFPQQDIRVAGGWVRDRLLQVKEKIYDIDITLNNESGINFAKRLVDYLDTNDYNDGKHKIGVIKANPEKSKHLETATMKLLNFECDFVNLRGEELYENANNRIPTNLKHFGTPVEDAYRRDFTMNSLFYNLKTQQVEDFSGLGLKDLKAGIVRTPLDPNVTLQDDPLRVLRAVRFAVRYNFVLADDLWNAITKTECVKQRLLSKVSRERVGRELGDMLYGKMAQPDKALCLIHDLGLEDAIFNFPYDELIASVGTINELVVCHNEDDDQVSKSSTDPRDVNVRRDAWEKSKESLQFIVPLINSLKQEQPNGINYDELYRRFNVPLLNLAVYLLPFGTLYYKDSKGWPRSVVAYIVHESIKFPKKDSTAISAILDNCSSFKHLIDDVLLGKDIDRLEVGLVLRKVKEDWVTSLAVASIAFVESTCDIDADSCHNLNAKVFNRFRSAYSAIVDEGLDGCWNTKPLLSGKHLISELGLGTGGPIVGLLMDDQVKWQLKNPNGTKQECVEYLMSMTSIRFAEVEPENALESSKKTIY